MKTKKAYIVNRDENSVVVFATSSAAARRQGAQEMDVEFSEVDSCRRASDYDQYVETGLPGHQVLIEKHGWWFECGGCHKGISNDDPEAPLAYDEHGYPFCSQKCLDEDIANTKMWHEKREVVREQALAKFPGVHITSQDDKKATFRFPGSRGVATWVVGETTVRTNEADKAAWDLYWEGVAPKAEAKQIA